jgi:hypothetical protein
MPTHAGPNITAANNLIFALDAADKKNSFLPSSTFLDMASWTLGSGGVGNYGQNGNTNENERVNGTDPWGNSAIVWESRPSGDGEADGGWNNGYYDIDRTKLYRWSVWVKRTSSTSGGTSYLGLYGSGGTWGVERLDNGANEGNPYWECNGTGAYTQNQWYLLVGHCYPAGTVGVSGNKHPDTGRYTINGRDGDLNYCNIGGDVRWLSNSTVGLHRTYHYYCGDNTTRLQWYDPRFEICDGTEPTIQDLLRSPATYGRNLISSNKAQLVNGVVWSRNNQGSFNFDGTNDYINCGSTEPFNLTSRTATWEVIVKFNSSSGNNGLVTRWNSSTGQVWWFGRYSSTKIHVAFTIDGNYHGLYSDGNIGTTPIYQHIVVTLNNTLITYYINGVLDSTDSIPAGTWTSDPDPNVILGAWNDGATDHLNGELPIVKLYNIALSANQVKQNYNQYKSRFNLS